MNLTLLWPLLTLLALCGCATTMHTTNGIPNLDLIEDTSFCGGQPTPAGWRWLQSMGITNVVKLNLESPYDGGSDEYAESLGMTVHWFPIDIYEQFGIEHPDNALAAQAFIGPHTFVHCLHGQDRTRLAVAIYRWKTQGWTKKKAEADMLLHGFHKFLHGLWDFWEDMD